MNPHTPAERRTNTLYPWSGRGYGLLLQEAHLDGMTHGSFCESFTHSRYICDVLGLVL